MRAVFLDFDGVLHRAGGPPGASMPFEWTNELALLLQRFEDVVIVVHSSWREQFSVDIIREFLEPVGHRVAGVVPRGPKSVAIETFLREHPEITDALVLDDQADEFPLGFHVPLSLCDPVLGLSSKETQEQVKAWLARGAAA